MTGTTEDRRRLRQIERHRSAALRAVAGEPSAEFAGQRLTLSDRAVPIAAPYLTGDRPNVSLAAQRGVADALGLRLRHSDLDLHRSLRPAPPFQQVVFDTLEQLRCDALAPDHLAGVRANIAEAFEEWDRATRAMGVAESGLGLLIYTVTHMARARFGTSVGLLDNETQIEIEAITEAPRAELGPLIGHDLVCLAETRHDQKQYAVHAAAIASDMAMVAGDAAARLTPTEAVDIKKRLMLAAAWDDGDSEHFDGHDVGIANAPSGDDGSGGLDGAGGYKVFSTEHDREVSGNDLLLPVIAQRCRSELDALIAAQAVSVPRLAHRLLERLGTSEPRSWHHGREDGLIDSSRLPQVVSSPGFRQAFRTPRNEATADLAVTFLIDTSGSMKLQRYEAVAVLVDTYCRALDLAGATTEVLGFTTAAWNGGRPLVAWRAAGEPGNPGRIGEACHIVYKDAESSWRRSRNALAAMLHTAHYREGLDGEAVVWAFRRLQARPEQRRILVFISDGAPNDVATSTANGESYLTDHLQAVARRIDRGHNGVEFGAIGIDLDMSWLVPRSISLDLSGTLTLSTYRALEHLVMQR